ncbi:Kef-type K+ transport system membrane component KefB [Saccharothrix longispora]|uniref:Kef-type K+ transport system membrane component KefB n=1 Tax=Saccharothrix longispora TaxID=33920 RepID=A0ABU1PQ56_9PSEU|nr:cation:proton antiporter [Saccharothrix longispora]MDR6592721.1 Kef-type K+ transport system membrane component KefB [Saccharothrix longispora]
MTDHVAVLLLDLALILLIAHAFGALARRFGQPPVIGEILAGILLGPTLFAGGLSAVVIPADVRPLLSPLANVGVALFMFLVGLELDRSLLTAGRRVMTGVALSATLVPFALGALLAWHLLDRHETTHPLGFVLFLGVAMGATAFPVLARILTDRGLRKTPLGALSLGIAAIGDVVVWSVLTGVVVLVGGTGSEWRLLLTVPYAAVLLFVVRPLLRRLGTRRATSGADTRRLVVITIGVLASGGATEWLGLHFAFGAFLFGFVFPKDTDSRLRADVARRVGSITSVLLPVYFVTAGLKVDLSTIDVSGFLDLALVLLVAVVGKGGRRLRRGAPAPGAPARRGVPRRAVEHARPDGTRHPHHRVATGPAPGGPVLADGRHGPGDHRDDRAAADAGRPGERAPLAPRTGRRRGAPRRGAPHRTRWPVTGTPVTPDASDHRGRRSSGRSGWNVGRCSAWRGRACPSRSSGGSSSGATSGGGSAPPRSSWGPSASPSSSTRSGWAPARWARPASSGSGCWRCPR